MYKKKYVIYAIIYTLVGLIFSSFITGCLVKTETILGGLTTANLIYRELKSWGPPEVRGSISGNIIPYLPASSLPAAPTGLRAENITGTSFHLFWNAVSNATSYKVYQDGSYLTSVIGISTEITGLTVETTYSMQVSGVNFLGEGPKSAALTVTTTSGES